MKFPISRRFSRRGKLPAAAAYENHAAWRRSAAADNTAEKAAVYVNGTPKLAVFLDKKEKYKPDNLQQQKLNQLLTTWIVFCVKMKKFIFVDKNFLSNR